MLHYWLSFGVDSGTIVLSDGGDTMEEDVEGSEGVWGRGAEDMDYGGTSGLKTGSASAHFCVRKS